MSDNNGGSADALSGSTEPGATIQISQTAPLAGEPWTPILSTALSAPCSSLATKGKNNAAVTASVDGDGD